MAYENLEYTKDWKNATDFPTHETSETKVREDMQYLFDEIKTYLNTKVIANMNATGLDDPIRSTGVKYVRMTTGNAFEFSADGTTWYTLDPNGLVSKNGDTMGGNLNISKADPALVLDETGGGNCYGDVSVASDKYMRLHVQEKGGGGNLPQAAGLMIAPFSGDDAFDDVLQVYTSSWETDEHGDEFVQTSYLPIIPASTRMSTGTYLGTGTYGQENPKTLSTWHRARAVLIWDESGAVQQLHPIIPGTTGRMAVTGGSCAVVYDAATPTRVSWYSAESAAKQFNALGQTYYYLIFG